MQSVSICHAPADSANARELARFIDVNFGFDISLDDALIGPHQDILAATERALSANFAIVLLSPGSVPAPLKRDRWEQVFLKAPAEYGTQLAFVLVGDCSYPHVLRRGHFFEGDLLDCKRGLKRWMLSPQAVRFSERYRIVPELEPIWRTVVDEPGCVEDADAETADTLAQGAREDFERTIRIRCGGRPLAVIVGELGRALGLPLTGPLDENLRGLAWHVMGRRHLIVFEGAALEQMGSLRFGGRCSQLFAKADRAPVMPVQQITPENPGEAIDYALALLGSNAETGGRVAQRVVPMLTDRGHNAEAVLLLEAMRDGGHSRADWIERELAWIRERWGESVEIPPTPIVDAMQLNLFGDGGWLAA